MSHRVAITFIIISLIIIGFFALPQFKKIDKGSVTWKMTPTLSSASITPSHVFLKQPSISTPSANAKVNSPLLVKGTVPPGWMFEGVFPIKLLDSQRNLISQAQAKEVIPGSWTSGMNNDFTASINFSTTVKSGFLVLEKDNPSGLSENAGLFEIPVHF